MIQGGSRYICQGRGGGGGLCLKDKVGLSAGQEDMMIRLNQCCLDIVMLSRQVSGSPLYA